MDNDNNIELDKADNPVGESFETIYDVYLPSGVVIPEISMENALNTIQHFRTKYPTGQMKVVRKETWTKETTVHIDG